MKFSPINKPPISESEIKLCWMCKKKHPMYPVYDEDTNEIGWWWCFNHNEPQKGEES